MPSQKDFTREEIVDALRGATIAVEEAGVPTDLRGAAFERAFGAILGLADPGPPPVQQPVEPISEAEGPTLSAVAARLKMGVEDIADAYHVDGDAIGLGIAPSRFDSRKAVGTKQIALLVAAGRQAAGLEEWTRVAVLREAVRDYGRFDASNFATTVKDMGDVFNLRGRGQQVEVRVTRPGFERAAKLLDELMGE